MRPNELLRSICSNSKLRWILCLCALAVMVCGLPHTARAQVGTILGTVTDQSGGVVPNAAVTITNNDTNLVTTETTGKEGDYVAPLLIIGRYTIEVKAQGFKTSKQTITLEVGDRRRVDFKLETGVVTETVTVTANPITVQADTNDISTVLTGAQLKALQIGSQSYFNLIDLVPGASPNNADIQFPLANGADNNISFNGQRAAHQMDLIDGGENSDRGGMGPYVNPSEQAISEVRVMTSNYSAEFGLASGETTTMVVQSGTSQFHASGWYFGRNNALAARNYFNPAPEPVAELRYDLFGFNVGGPVEFTSKHPKTFFFFNMEWRKQVTPGAGNQLVIPPSMYPTSSGANLALPAGSAGIAYNGSIPNTPYNCNVSTGVTNAFSNAEVPLSQCGTAPESGPVLQCGSSGLVAGEECYNIFPSNTIPMQLMKNMACINASGVFTASCGATPNAVALMNAGFFPTPTSGLGSSLASNTWVNTAKAPIDMKEEIVRIDHTFNEHWSIFGHFIGEQMTQTDIPSRWVWASTLPGASDIYSNPGYHAVVHLTNTISPTLLNEIAFNYGENPISITPLAAGGFNDTGDVASTIGFSQNRFFGQPTNILPISILFLAQQNVFFNTNWWPWYNWDGSYEIRDDLSWTKGTHQIKVGFGWYKYDKKQDLQTNISGQFQFNGQYTGYAYSDFLLGLSNSYSEAALEDARQWNSVSWSSYVEDDWRATKRLTLNLGLRWDGMPHTAEVNNQMADFYPNLFNSVGWTAAASANMGFVPGTNGTVICSGETSGCAGANPFLGTGPNPNLNGLLQYDNGIGVAGKTAGVTGALVPNYWDTFGPRIGFAYDLTGNGKSILRAGFGMFYERIQGNDMYQVAMNLFGGNASVNNVSFQNPHVGITNANIVYSTATLPVTVNGISGPNALDYKTPTSYEYSIGVQQQITRQTVLSVEYVGNQGRHESEYTGINNPPYTLLGSLVSGGGYSAGISNEFLPYPGYAGIGLASDDARSRYNSLQVSLRSQYRNLIVQGAYTFAHAYDPTSGANGDGFDLDATTNPYLGWLYDYGPAASNRDNIFFVDFVYTLPTLAGHNAILREVAGGWQLAGIITAETGVPMSVGIGGNVQTVCNAIPTQGGGCSVRPNLVGPITYPQTPAVLNSGIGSIQWFNPSVFKNNYYPATPGGDNANSLATFGDLQNNGVWGPGRQNWDLSLIKDFTFTERLKLEVRCDAVNVWNHPQWQGVDTGTGDQNFGMVTSAYEGRVLQLAAKISF